MKKGRIIIITASTALSAAAIAANILMGIGPARVFLVASGCILGSLSSMFPAGGRRPDRVVSGDYGFISAAIVITAGILFNGTYLPLVSSGLMFLAYYFLTVKNDARAAGNAAWNGLMINAVATLAICFILSRTAESSWKILLPVSGGILSSSNDWTIPAGSALAAAVFTLLLKAILGREISSYGLGRKNYESGINYRLIAVLVTAAGSLCAFLGFALTGFLGCFSPGILPGRRIAAERAGVFVAAGQVCLGLFVMISPALSLLFIAASYAAHYIIKSGPVFNDRIKRPVSIA
ncbi:MAG: hypothetical protein MUD12_06540 [Spirochaetes bacterium]|jgi:hypothetical protein|nr:hypothetical protein [Spirochaetota bacterium]